jgi:hypothetical protein
MHRWRPDWSCADLKTAEHRSLELIPFWDTKTPAKIGFSTASPEILAQVDMMHDFDNYKNWKL